jgi:apolipoprotein N-acyltransferase
LNSTASRLRAGAGSVAAGFLMAVSLPPVGLWPLAPIGIAVLDRQLDGRPPVSRFWRAFVAQLAVFLPTLFWLQYLTLPGWLVTAAFFPALFGAGAALLPPSRIGRWLALPGMWVAFDALRSRWPFGGIPLSTLAYAEIGGPLAPVARAGSALLLIGITVVAGVALAAASRRAWGVAGAGAAVVLAVTAFGAVAPRGHATGSLNVALVQGGGPTGHRDVEADDERVFQAHLSASELIEPPVDLVLWPEDVVDVDGDVTESTQGDALSELARRLGAPLVVGTVETIGDSFRNSALVVNADGSFGDRYSKVRRVPFGEYTPLRSLIEPFAGGGLISREALPGADPATLETSVGRLGVVISWEVFFADRARNAVDNGGAILLNPTNGATFRGTQVQTQQLAASRLRAIETGRWVLQVAPTGFSAVITPDGDVVERTGIGEATVIQLDVDTRTGLTLATRLGDWPALGFAAVSMGAGWAVDRRRARRGADADGQGADTQNVNDGRVTTAVTPGPGS